MKTKKLQVYYAAVVAWDTFFWCEKLSPLEFVVAEYELINNQENYTFQAYWCIFCELSHKVHLFLADVV